MLRQNPPSRDLLQKMPLRKLSHFCIRYLPKTKCKSKKQPCNDAPHVKTSQSAQTQLDPAKNRNRPKMPYMPPLHESLQLCTMQYIRDFPRDDCARNISEGKSTMRQGLICVEILPLQVLPPSPPAK